MSHIEQEEIPSQYTRSLVGSAGSKEQLRQRHTAWIARTACVTWQSLRLLLLSWSLLCLYCALRAALSSREIDFPAVSLHLLMGIGAWWLVCRATTTPEWRTRS